MTERFGEFARKTRVASRVSLRLVAERLGWTPAYVSDIERGNRGAPVPAKAREWAIIVHGDPDDFAERSLLDRKVVELPVTGMSAKTRAAAMLARSWDELSPAQEDELMRSVERLLLEGSR